MVVTVGTTEAEVGVTMVLAWPGVMTVGRGEATVVGINMLAWGAVGLCCVLHCVLFCLGFQVRSNVTVQLSGP